MRYQWGRKDPFTFATNSEQWGSAWYDRGKYPVKLYNSSSVLIYQVDNGGDNTNSKPSGVFHSSTNASSMNDAVANPITFYYGGSGIVINQSGQSGDIYNYYWSSYSRGTDGNTYRGVSNWHNDYLDSYIPSRHKSIYDPCPYGYRIPSNGTYNEFTNKGWITFSYVGGFAHTIMSNSTWFTTGRRSIDNNGGFSNYGFIYWQMMSTSGDYYAGYSICIESTSVIKSRSDAAKSYGFSIRCIEDCSVVSDATEASAGY